MKKVQILSQNKTKSEFSTDCIDDVFQNFSEDMVGNLIMTDFAKKNIAKEKPAKKTKVLDAKNNSSKKNKNNKRISHAQDSVWVEIDAQEEKKKQKVAKKARLKEVYSNELVPKKSLAKMCGNQQKNASGNNKNIDLLVLKPDAKKILEIEKYEEGNLQNTSVRNVIVDSITSIIHSAEEENRENEEKISKKRKAKRALKQNGMMKSNKNIDAGEVYPIQTSLSIQEHVLYNEIIEHGLHVANYVRMLFLGLESLHGLSPVWLQRLLLAAQYHDIGSIDAEKSHHKHSYTRIRSDAGILIDGEDREMVSLLARYHRRALPSQGHSEFAKLSMNDQEELCKAASLLRMADALDYNHQGMIKQVDVHVDTFTVTLVCHSPRDISREIVRIASKSDLFVRTFQREVVCKKR